LYRVHLTDEQRQELHRRAHEPGVRPRTRDRLEMVRLSDAGWSVPQIARHLGSCEPTVRRWIKTFLAHGFDALRDPPPAGRTSRLTPAIREALRQELAKGERTWTAAQLAQWIEAQFGVRVSAAHLRRFRRRWKLSWKRTGRSVNHKQKPDEVAAKKTELEAEEKRGSRACLISTIATRWASR
jgi:transposase